MRSVTDVDYGFADVGRRYGRRWAKFEESWFLKAALEIDYGDTSLTCLSAQKKSAIETHQLAAAPSTHKRPIPLQ
jgi:hypothetical protein